MSDLLLQWFSCCSHQHHVQTQRRHLHRPLVKIDRSMIGLPQNFVHTAHIGSGDVEMSTRSLHEMQKQMESKGGYRGVQVRRTAAAAKVVDRVITPSTLLQAY